ncbi:MAG: 4-hydroxy-3-methylbut-2-enyl diphosphate reductase [Roseovarius sp.]|nr:4-hydroxy-3-methylbut-2-enyl diphosphate reductase [Roseovarius sp.]
MTKGSGVALYMAKPHGFCAGVVRAIQIVEKAIEKWGPPVYVRHEIVHNKYVIDSLRRKGAVFVEELDECPDDRPVIFSAHGVPKSVPNEARRRNMVYVDATCPLVSKVHIEAARYAEKKLQIIFIGHAGHPETLGTMGQVPKGDILLVETLEDVAALKVRDPEKVAYVTQTTLSIDDAAEIVSAIKTRFPGIVEPHKEDICYATTNRQEAVKAIAGKIDAMLVVGSKNSSNTCRLVEVAGKCGCPHTQLVERASDIDWDRLKEVSSIGISAGASAPDILVKQVVDALDSRFELEMHAIETAREDLQFKMPRILQNPLSE